MEEEQNLRTAIAAARQFHCAAQAHLENAWAALVSELCETPKEQHRSVIDRTAGELAGLLTVHEFAEK